MAKVNFLGQNVKKKSHNDNMTKEKHQGNNIIPSENQDSINCVNCGKSFYLDRDLWICDDCINLFDLNKLWSEHDTNKIDALDFNENKLFREKYRK